MGRDGTAPSAQRPDWVVVVMLTLTGGTAVLGGVIDTVAGDVRGGRASGVALLGYGSLMLWGAWRANISASWQLFLGMAPLLLASDAIDHWLTGHGYVRPNLVVVLVIAYWLWVLWRSRRSPPTTAEALPKAE